MRDCRGRCDPLQSPALKDLLSGLGVRLRRKGRLSPLWKPWLLGARRARGLQRQCPRWGLSGLESGAASGRNSPPSPLPPAAAPSSRLAAEEAGSGRWDPGPLCCRACTWTHVSSRSKNETAGLTLRLHARGAACATHGQAGRSLKPTLPRTTSCQRSRGAARGPCTQHPEGVGRPPNHPLWAKAWTQPCSPM